jgi:hypothetical protein
LAFIEKSAQFYYNMTFFPTPTCATEQCEAVSRAQFGQLGLVEHVPPFTSKGRPLLSGQN